MESFKFDLLIVIIWFEVVLNLLISFKHQTLSQAQQPSGFSLVNRFSGFLLVVLFVLFVASC